MTPIRFKGGEFAFTDWIRDAPGEAVKRLVVGPGDDACVFEPKAGERVCVTTDMLLEGTHFDRAKATLEQIGWKSVGVSLSDVAAMGMRPVLIVAGVGVPKGMKRDGLEALYRGMRALCDGYQVPIAGGDVTSWDADRLVLCTTAVGVGETPILRSTARPGDAIVVTGELGGSLRGRHLRFIPRVAQSWVLVCAYYHVHAMIDISDGLSADLAHIARESNVGAVIDAACVPVSEDAKLAAAEDGRSPLDHALNDGEDFELLFTMDAKEAEELFASQPFDTRLSIVGKIVEGDELMLRDAEGVERPLSPGGYEHLREG